jgi:hypothetical protein
MASAQGISEMDGWRSLGSGSSLTRLIGLSMDGSQVFHLTLFLIISDQLER